MMILPVGVCTMIDIEADFDIVAEVDTEVAELMQEAEEHC